MCLIFGWIMLATRACNSYFTLLLCPWPHFQSSPLLYVGREAIQQLVLWSNSITSQSQGFNSGNNSWQSFRNIIECLLNQGYCCIQLEVGKVFVIWISGISTIQGLLELCILLYIPPKSFPIFTIAASSQCFSNGKVCLVGGANSNEGRVEVCVNGMWGTVSNYQWDSREATVVCKQLGYQNPGEWSCCKVYQNYA